MTLLVGFPRFSIIVTFIAWSWRLCIFGKLARICSKRRKQTTYSPLPHMQHSRHAIKDCFKSPWNCRTQRMLNYPQEQVRSSEKIQSRMTLCFIIFNFVQAIQILHVQKLCLADDLRQEQGEQNFWRIKEAALLAVQSLADEIVQNPGAQDFIVTLLSQSSFALTLFLPQFCVDTYAHSPGQIR